MRRALLSLAITGLALAGAVAGAAMLLALDWRGRLDVAARDAEREAGEGEAGAALYH